MRNEKANGDIQQTFFYRVFCLMRIARSGVTKRCRLFGLTNSALVFERYTRIEQNRIEQNRIKQNRIEQNRIEQNRIEQNRIEQNRIEQNRLEQNRIEQNRIDSYLYRERDRMRGVRVKGSGYPQSTYRGRIEIGGVYLPFQLERTLKLCT